MDDLCPACGEESGITMGYNNMGEEIACANCGKTLLVEYEECWDGEEETQHWWLTVVRP